jgi:hypothetical protein
MTNPERAQKGRHSYRPNASLYSLILNNGKAIQEEVLPQSPSSGSLFGRIGEK